jgi:hypothetical protein
LQASRTALIVVFSVAIAAIALNLADSFVVDDYIISFASSKPSSTIQMVEVKRSRSLKRSFHLPSLVTLIISGPTLGGFDGPILACKRSTCVFCLESSAPSPETAEHPSDRICST